MTDMRFHMADMSPAEAAKFIANIAQMTATNSQNWENFERICESMIVSAMEAGRKYGRDEALHDQPAEHKE